MSKQIHLRTISGRYTELSDVQKIVLHGIKNQLFDTAKHYIYRDPAVNDNNCIVWEYLYLQSDDNFRISISKAKLAKVLQFNRSTLSNSINKLVGAKLKCPV
jgi:hypothetical protein